MILNLFPTKVLIHQLPSDRVLELVSSFAEYDRKDWESLGVPFNDILDIVASEYGGSYEIVDGWIRNGYNSFDIHCDNHYGNQLVSVVQLYGDEGKGGDLVLYDPAWRNPQWVSDTKQPDSNTYVVPFKIGQAIVFPSDVWHKVTNYTGDISRITLNLMLRKIND